MTTSTNNDISKLFDDLNQMILKQNEQLNKMMEFLTGLFRTLIVDREENEKIINRYGSDCIAYLDVLQKIAANQIKLPQESGNLLVNFRNFLLNQVFFSIQENVSKMKSNQECLEATDVLKLALSNFNNSELQYTEKFPSTTELQKSDKMNIDWDDTSEQEKENNQKDLFYKSLNGHSEANAEKLIYESSKFHNRDFKNPAYLNNEQISQFSIGPPINCLNSCESESSNHNDFDDFDNSLLEDQTTIIEKLPSRRNDHSLLKLRMKNSIEKLNNSKEPEFRLQMESTFKQDTSNFIPSRNFSISAIHANNTIMQNNSSNMSLNSTVWEGRLRPRKNISYRD